MGRIGGEKGKEGEGTRRGREGEREGKGGEGREKDELSLQTF